MKDNNLVPENDPENEVNINPEIAKQIMVNFALLVSNFQALLSERISPRIRDDIMQAREILNAMNESHDFSQIHDFIQHIEAAKFTAAKHFHVAIYQIVTCEFYAWEVLADTTYVKPRNEPPTYGNIGWVNGGES